MELYDLFGKSLAPAVSLVCVYDFELCLVHINIKAAHCVLVVSSENYKEGVGGSFKLQRFISAVILPRAGEAGRTRLNRAK